MVNTELSMFRIFINIGILCDHLVAPRLGNNMMGIEDYDIRFANDETLMGLIDRGFLELFGVLHPEDGYLQLMFQFDKI